MSDFELVDVTSMDGSSIESNDEGIKCIYCGCLKDGVLMFYCVQCCQWVHASCLHSGPPSLILGDNYYIFKCCNCTLDKKESFQRIKMTWVQVVTMALYNLAQTNFGKQGFFKWKEDICVFIEKYWESFFGNEKKRTQQWYCTVASILSSGNPHRFQSGYTQFGETGWWRLIDPTKAPEYQPRSLTGTVPRARNTRKSHFGSTSRAASRKRQQANAMQFASEAKTKQACFKDNRDVAYDVSAKKATEASKSKSNATSVGKNMSGSSPMNVISDVSSMPDSPASFSNDGRGFPAKETRVDPNLPLAAISDDESFEDLSMMQKDWKDFEDADKCCNGSEKTARSRLKNVTDTSDASHVTEVKPMSLYDEHKLLKKLISLQSTENNLCARRLKRKLLLRQKKREIGLSVLNFDATVRQLEAKEKGLNPNLEDLLDVAVPLSHSTEHRILDRFLVPDARLSQTEEVSRTFHQKLVGGDKSSPEPAIVSPYTRRVLKPFIRRDFETKPPKLKLLEEIVSHRHRSDSSRQREPSSPIDYCYVRPKHIPAINGLCWQFFWPGIDLSESLQYPDFSVVALYRKMVIGFGFLVPDVAFNESYISFLLVHPDWQRSGVGTFMLYHLIQTCMGKDVTLHVSASNSAMLLYQRFGFKPEKFEADFYDKYLPTDARDCNHAFFMRLQR